MITIRPKLPAGGVPGNVPAGIYNQVNPLVTKWGWGFLADISLGQSFLQVLVEILCSQISVAHKFTYEKSKCLRRGGGVTNPLRSQLLGGYDQILEVIYILGGLAIQWN